MSRILLLFIFIQFSISCTSQQVNEGVRVFSEGLKSKGITSEEAGAGLKNALIQGSYSASNQLSKKNGFLKNEAVKILFPPEFEAVEEKLRAMGLGALADKTIVSFNRAAEKAAAKASPILKKAVMDLSFEDAMKILLGDNNAATEYLRAKTTDDLRNAFRPVVKRSADSVSATKYWDQVATAYNRIPFVKDIPDDITEYITKESLKGLFYRIEKEEFAIRENPQKRVNDILRRVFAYADSNQPSTRN